MQVVPIQPADIPAWLDLAAEVASLPSPMVADSALQQALERNIQWRRACYVRSAGWRSAG